MPAVVACQAHTCQGRRSSCGPLVFVYNPVMLPSSAVLSLFVSSPASLFWLQGCRSLAPSDMALLWQAVESIQAEDESAKLCKRRIEHLKEHSSDQPAAASLWKRKRMDRMMVEHLLRCGYYNTAVKLARQSGIEVGGPPCLRYPA